MGYLFCLHDDQRIIVALQSHFLEDEFIQEGGASTKIVLEEQNETPVDISTQEVRTEPSVTQPQPRRLSKVSQPPERYGYLVQRELDLHSVLEEDHGDDPSHF